MSSPAVHEGRLFAAPAFLWPTWHRQDEHHPGLCQDALLCKGIQLHGVRGVCVCILDVTFDQQVFGSRGNEGLTRNPI